MYTCPKCLGAKVLEQFAHIQGGTCYRCAGHGRVTHIEYDEHQDQSCDAIHALAHIDENNDAHIIQFFVWDTDPNKDNYGIGNFSYIKKEGNVIEKNHLPLAELRVLYKQYRDAGYRKAAPLDMTLLFDQREDYNNMIEAQDHAECERRLENHMAKIR